MLRRQKDKKDFWDKYEDVSIDSSSDNLSSNKYSFGEKKLMIEDNRRDNIQKRLEDDNGGL